MLRDFRNYRLVIIQASCNLFHHVWWAFLLLIYIVECEMKKRFQFTQRLSFQNQLIFFLNACQFLKIRKIMRAPQSMHWLVSHSFLFHFICEPNKISAYLNKSVYTAGLSEDLLANKDITVDIKNFSFNLT